MASNKPSSGLYYSFLFFFNDAAADEMVVASDGAGNMVGQVSDPGSLSHHLTIADDG